MVDTITDLHGALLAVQWLFRAFLVVRRDLQATAPSFTLCSHCWLFIVMSPDDRSLIALD